jgi:hypothetical protein
MRHTSEPRSGQSLLERPRPAASGPGALSADQAGIQVLQIELAGLRSNGVLLKLCLARNTVFKCHCQSTQLPHTGLDNKPMACHTRAISGRDRQRSRYASR